MIGNIQVDDDTAKALQVVANDEDKEADEIAADAIAAEIAAAEEGDEIAADGEGAEVAADEEGDEIEADGEGAEVAADEEGVEIAADEEGDEITEEIAKDEENKIDYDQKYKNNEVSESGESTPVLSRNTSASDLVYIKEDSDDELTLEQMEEENRKLELLESEELLVRKALDALEDELEKIRHGENEKLRRAFEDEDIVEKMGALTTGYDLKKQRERSKNKEQISKQPSHTKELKKYNL